MIFAQAPATDFSSVVKVLYEYRTYGYALVFLLVLLIVFYIVSYLIRRATNRRAPAELAISFDDLEGMVRTGLLSDEEREKVRKSISRQWVDRQTAPGTSLTDLQLSAAQALSEKDASPGEGQTGPESTHTPDTSLSELAHAGRVSGAEMERLQGILARRKRKKG
jgi:hypothetical protein